MSAICCRSEAKWTWLNLAPPSPGAPSSAPCRRTEALLVCTMGCIGLSPPSSFPTTTTLSACVPLRWCVTHGPSRQHFKECTATHPQTALALRLVFHKLITVNYFTKKLSINSTKEKHCVKNVWRYLCHSSDSKADEVHSSVPVNHHSVSDSARTVGYCTRRKSTPLPPSAQTPELVDISPFMPGVGQKTAL